MAKAAAVKTKDSEDEVIIPPKDIYEMPFQCTITSSVGRVAEIELLCAAEGRSRNEIAEHLWATSLKLYWKEKKRERPEDPLAALQSINPKKAAELKKKVG